MWIGIAFSVAVLASAGIGLLIAARSAPHEEPLPWSAPDIARMQASLMSAMGGVSITGVVLILSFATNRAEQVSSISGIDIHGRPEVNAVFAQLPRSVIDDLQRWSFFWDWDTNENLVRWMTSFETTEADVERFVAGLRHFMSIQR